MSKPMGRVRGPQDVLSPVVHYYSEKLREFGATPKGVDWNGPESQRVRFAQLCKIITNRQSLSLNDLGCGYGALCQYLEELGLQVDYRGNDLSEGMIQAAKEMHGGVANRQFFVGAAPAAVADYSVASGVFNVRLDADPQSWLAYIHEFLDILHRSSRFGFAFNCLSSYCDAERRRPDLFYGDPLHFFDICVKQFSRHAALLQDYGLFEFTILVRKDL